MSIIFILGLFMGLGLIIILNKISKKISGAKILQKKYLNILVVCFSIFVTISCYFRFGVNMVFLQGILLGYILILVFFIDLEYRIIPNFIVILTIIIGIIFIFQVNPLNAALGMLAGGGLLFLLALIPGSIGGGDVKLMAALGLFLGVKKILIALLIAFALGAIFSVFMIILRKKEKKDYIAFGPFLAVGSFIAFLF